MTFNSGDTEKTFIFSATQDTVDDDGESVKLTFGTLPTGVSEGTIRETVVTITDNDDPQVTVSFEQSTYTVPEGSSETIKVKLNADPERTVTIQITRDDLGGVTTTDYSGVPQSVTFNNGQMEKTFSFSAANDSDNDDGESVKLGLSPVTQGVTVGSPSETTVSITDDDTAGVTVSETALTIQEGNTDTYTVVLDTRPAGDVTVTISGHAGTDVSLDKTGVTFTRGNWATAQTVTVTAEEDADSQDEAAVTLSHAVSSTADTDYNGISAGAVTVTITDDDDAGVTVTPTELTVTEGETSTYTVVLDTEPTGNVTVTITDPTDNTDVTADPASLTFTDLDWYIAQTVTVGAAEDGDAADETATITHTVTGYGTVTTADAVTVTVQDDAPGALTVNFGESSYTAAEGSTVSVKVQLSADPERTVTIQITRDDQGGAMSTDYSGVPDEVTFNSGDTEVSFTFSATQDTVDDDGESVKLTFGTLPTGVSTASPNETTISINDDDTDEQPQETLQVSFDSSRYTAFEGGPGARVTVKLNVPTTVGTAIPITATGMNGATPDDWTGVPRKLTISPGRQSQTFTVMAFDDNIEDDGEAVELGFGILPGGVAPTSPATAIVDLLETVELVCDNQANKIIVLEAIGEIGQSGESIFWSVQLDPNRFYIIEAIGADDGRDLLGEDTYSGNLTLEDPDIIAVWTAPPERILGQVTGDGAGSDLGHGRNSIVIFRGDGLVPVEVEVASGNGGTGTYQIKVRVNNVCAIIDGRVIYPWAGGPEGYTLDLPADMSTRGEWRVIPVNSTAVEYGFLGDNWDSAPDEDWYRMELDEGYEYTVEFWADTEYPVRHQATDLRIVGIFDGDGNLMANTAGSGSGKNVSVVFQPDDPATYYASVSSGGADQAGVYVARLSGRLIE